MCSLSACTHDCSKSFTITKSLYSQRNIWLVHVTDDYSKKTTNVVISTIEIERDLVRRDKKFFNQFWIVRNLNELKEIITVSGPVTLVGGGIDRNVLRSSGPGLFRDRRLRAWFDDDKPTLLNGFAAKSNPFLVCQNENRHKKMEMKFIACKRIAVNKTETNSLFAMRNIRAISCISTTNWIHTNTLVRAHSHKHTPWCLCWPIFLSIRIVGCVHLGWCQT